MLQIEVKQQKNITVEDKTDYPVYHVQVDVKKNCLICKKTYEWSDFYRTWRGGYASPNNGICDNCNFWTETAVADKHRKFAIVERTHYVLGSELQIDTLDAQKSLRDIVASLKTIKKAGKGFGGDKFIAWFNDGRALITDDLWHQGTIPEHFINPDQDDLDIPSFIRKNPMLNNAELEGVR